MSAPQAAGSVSTRRILLLWHRDELSGENAEHAGELREFGDVDAMLAPLKSADERAVQPDRIADLLLAETPSCAEQLDAQPEGPHEGPLFVGILAAGQAKAVDKRPRHRSAGFRSRAGGHRS